MQQYNFFPSQQRMLKKFLSSKAAGLTDVSDRYLRQLSLVGDRQPASSVSESGRGISGAGLPGQMLYETRTENISREIQYSG
jgi:hypothetical protein